MPTRPEKREQMIGMFWWGPTIRGTRPNAVIKDYSVKGGN